MNISKLLVYVDCFVCDVGGVCRIDDFRQVHSRRQKAVAEIVAERLHVSDLEKYVDSEYSGRYVDAILCEELKSSMLDVYNRVCDVERRSRILMSHNPSIAKFKDDFENLHSIVDAHNNCFKDDKLREHKAFFDTVLAYPLNDQQRRSIVSEEQNCLVVSSAGSGKTSSIVGKVEYLIQKNTSVRRGYCLSVTLIRLLPS